MIHPRRLKGTPTNLTRYYMVGDYYTKGTDEHSQWGGTIAAELGLEGKVDPSTFQALLDGKIGEQQLGRRRCEGKIQHHPGWDFAVNAPKSVSIMALVAGDERVIAAHEKAVSMALSYLEEHATLRHRVDGNIVHETTGRLIYARFTEHASRELDPHLHTHVVVMNMTNRADGTSMSSLETRAMFSEQLVAGQVYRNDLAHRLKELGYGIDYDPRKGLFEIGDVPKELIKHMSQRAEQIEAHAKENGLAGQAARRMSFYQTRGSKEKLSLDQLHSRWSARLGVHQHAIKAVKEVAQQNGERSIDIEPATAARATLFGLRQAEGREAVNNLGRLLRIGLASHVGEVRLEDIRPLAQAHEARARLLETRHPSGDEIHTRGRTSRRTARLELALSDQLALALNDAKPVTTREKLQYLADENGLNAEQAAALVMIGTTVDRVVGVHGVAGAGKSTLVRVLNAAAGPETTLIALAPTSSAAANLGHSAGIESRTVASLIAGGGRNVDDRHVLILDEAGQLGNRQAMRVLEISRKTGARLILLGDNMQTGAIEQGKAFWLMQQLGLPKAELTASVRQETRPMKVAVTQARLENYRASLASLDKVVSGDTTEKLAQALVGEWTRLGNESRAKTNILVLENATRLILNDKIREALKAEGALAAQGTGFSILTPSGMTDQEKRFPRFYTRGQVVIFSRDDIDLGVVQDTQYRVAGIAKDGKRRQRVRLSDENDRTILWDPRLSRTSKVKIFNEEQRNLAKGDRIQWRLVDHTLGIRNADRGTVEQLTGRTATILWDRDGRLQEIDLARHKNWDHGYAETVYSAQSKTYDRVYVLAPVGSSLVTGKNYYTAITRARFGVKLWTENMDRLIEKLERNSGTKTSALEGLGRLVKDSVKGRAVRHGHRWDELRVLQQANREARKMRTFDERQRRSQPMPGSLATGLAGRAQSVAQMLDQWLTTLLSKSDNQHRQGIDQAAPQQADVITPTQSRDFRGGHER
ncbi:MAG: MobF family relaxase [bacterium]|nr:MobF family relaxase [bacterium]